LKAALAAAWLLTLAAAFALGRLGAGAPEPGEPAGGDLRAALYEADPLARSLHLATFLDRLGPERLPEVLERMREPDFPMEEDEVRLLMLAWARFDPAGAFETARQWPGAGRPMLEDAAIWAWGFVDGAGALRALDATGDPELIARLRPTLVSGWLKSPDRELSSGFIAQVEDPRIRRRLAFRLTGEIARNGIDEVMRWAESVPDDLPNNFKAGAFYYAAGAVARKDPRRAAEWFLAHRAQPYSSGGLINIARKWAHYHDAPALFEWLLALPTTGERQNERIDAVSAGFRTWYKRAPDEATAWLAAAPQDPVWDAAVAELVRTLSFTKPDEAVEWAQRIQDETQRRRSTQLAGRRWAGSDMEAARAWLAKSDVSEDLRQSILRNPKTPSRRPRVAPPEPSTL